MTITGIEAAQRVKGWLGFALSIIPFLQFVPIPVVQAALVPVSEFLLVFVGAGAVLQASSPAIIGRKEK